MSPTLKIKQPAATFHKVIIAIDRFTAGDNHYLAVLESIHFEWSELTQERILIYLNRGVQRRVEEIQRNFETDLRVCAKNQQCIRYALDRHRDQFSKLIRFTTLGFLPNEIRLQLNQNLEVSIEKMRLRLREVFSRNSEVIQSLSRYRFLDDSHSPVSDRT